MSANVRYVALTAAPIGARMGLVVIEDGTVHGTTVTVPAARRVMLVAATTTRGAAQARLYLLRDDIAREAPPTFRVVDGTAPAGADVIAQHAGVTVYRTVASLRRRAAWHAGRVNGSRDHALETLVALERVIVLAAEQGRVDADADAAWSRYTKLKALALAPGTPGEGEAALRRALGIARTLAGLKEDTR